MSIVKKNINVYDRNHSFLCHIYFDSGIPGMSEDELDDLIRNTYKGEYRGAVIVEFT